jgi:hypothetical protein
MIFGTALVLALLLALAAVLHRYGAPRGLANSFVGAPVVSLFNVVREHAYFTYDEHCLRQLQMAHVGFRFVAAPRQPDVCPLRNVVRMLPKGLLRRPLYMTCRLASALDRFDRHVLQPAAERHFGQPVAHLVENGVRNCRTVAGYRSLLSEHAFANAIDVEGFVLRDGTAIEVAGARGASGPPAEFLREVTTGACDVFSTVLGPDFDEHHADHLHLDMALLGGCSP